MITEREPLVAPGACVQIDHPLPPPTILPVSPFLEHGPRGIPLNFSASGTPVWPGTLTSHSAALEVECCSPVPVLRGSGGGSFTRETRLNSANAIGDSPNVEKSDVTLFFQ